MNIKSTAVIPQRKNPVSISPTPSTQSEGWTLPDETFKRVGRGVVGAAYGAIPVVGTATNGLGALAAGFSDMFSSEEGGDALVAGTLGAIANIAGTLTLVGGALTGSDTAMKVSYGLLGASAVGGAYVAFVD